MQTKDIEQQATQAIDSMVATGDRAEIDTLPSSIYEKQQYETGSTLYIILPKHSKAIPYKVSTAADQVLQALIACKDVTSSQEYTDYPIVTHRQLEMWYADYEIQAVLKTVPVHKPKAICSGWELRQVEDKMTCTASVAKAQARLLALDKNPFYAKLDKDSKYQARAQYLVDGK